MRAQHFVVPVFIHKMEFTMSILKSLFVKRSSALEAQIRRYVDIEYRGVADRDAVYRELLEAARK
jgi:hypothetical protein